MLLVLGAFLVAHALIHLSYLTPAPPRTAGGPEWPFAMDRSWLVTGVGVDPDVARTLGTVLVAPTAALFVAAGLATLGWLLPTAWWPTLVVGGSVLSAITLALFFHPWLVLGLVIDWALLWAVLVLGWSPATSVP
jgi:hypothetical protein